MKNQKMDLAVLVKTETSSGFGYGSGHFHIWAEVITLEDGQVRGIPSSVYGTINGFAKLDGIRTTSQGTNDDRPHGLYAFEVEYYEERFVRLREAEEMSATLKKIEKGLAKLAEKRGYCKSYGEYVGRVCEVIGATKVVELVKQGTRGYHSDNEYRIHDLGDGVNFINGLVWKWQNPKEAEEAAS